MLFAAGIASLSTWRRGGSSGTAIMIGPSLRQNYLPANSVGFGHQLKDLWSLIGAGVRRASHAVDVAGCLLFPWWLSFNMAPVNYV